MALFEWRVQSQLQEQIPFDLSLEVRMWETTTVQMSPLPKDVLKKFKYEETYVLSTQVHEPLILIAKFDVFNLILILYVYINI